VSPNQAAYEMQLIAEVYGKTEGLRLRHMVLSFSAEEMKFGRTRKYIEVERIAQYAASYYKNDYQIIYAVHEDAKNLHIHFVMNTVSYRTGRKYRGDKADYYAFQSYLGSFLKEYYKMSLCVASDRNS